MNHTNIIYGLKDPRNDVYQYIGKSTVGDKRALSHLTQSHSPQIKSWIESLAENWLYPIIEIIEEVENLDDLPDREKYWIGYYHQINSDLLNVMLVPNNLVDTRTDEHAKQFDELVRVMPDVHSILKRERLCRRITQDELAKLMGVSRSTLSLLENGDSVNLSVVQKCVRTLKGIDIVTKVINQRA
jgi:hypothetical protein